MFWDLLPPFFDRYLKTHTSVSVKSDQRVCLVPLAILLSFDELISRFSSATAPPVVGNRGTLICPELSKREIQLLRTYLNSATESKRTVAQQFLAAAGSGPWRRVTMLETPAPSRERGVSGSFWVVGRSVFGRIVHKLVSIMIQRGPRVNKSLLVLRMSRLILHVVVQTAWRTLQLKSRVAIGRQLHTRGFQHRSAMRSCYHQKLSSDKRETSLGHPCGSRQCHQCILLPVAQLSSAQLVQFVGRNLHV